MSCKYDVYGSYMCYNEKIIEKAKFDSKTINKDKEKTFLEFQKKDKGKGKGKGKGNVSTN